MSKLLKNRRLWQCLVLLAAMLLWASALSRGLTYQRTANTIGLRYDEASISLESIQNAVREGQTVGGWKLGNSSYITSPVNAKSIEIQPLYIYGDSGLIFSDGAWLSGGAPMADTPQYCAIDKDTAYTLWGSWQVIGETLEYNGKEYTIMGIFEQKSPTLVLAVSQSGEETVSALEIPSAPMESTKQTVENFTNSYGFPTPASIQDGPGLASGMVSLAMVPGWILFFVLLCKGIATLFRHCHYPVAVLLLLLIMVVFFFVMARAVALPSSIPRTLIPNRWSDFSFWPELLESWQDSLTSYIGRAVIGPDIERNQAFIALVVQMLFSLPAFYIASRLERDTRTNRDLFFTVVRGLIITFGAILMIQYFQNGIATHRTLWLTWVLYAGGLYGLRVTNSAFQRINPPGKEAQASES